MGGMDHAASYPGEWGQEQVSPISPSHSEDTNFCWGFSPLVGAQNEGTTVALLPPS